MGSRRESRRGVATATASYGYRYVLATDAALCCVKIAEKPKSSEIYDCHKIAWICGKCAPATEAATSRERQRERERESGRERGNAA